MIKIHFGFFEDCGDYEHPLSFCEKTVCGCLGETVLENYTVENWKEVTCKKCLRLKEAVIAGQKANEEAILYLDLKKQDKGEIDD